MDSVRFILVSKDPVFSKVVREGLALFPVVSNVVNLINFNDVESRLTRLFRTLILCDLDTINIDPISLARIEFRFPKTITVITGTSGISIKKLLKPNVVECTPKPTSRSSVSIFRFLSLVITRARGIDSQKIINYKEVSKTIDVSDKIIAIASSTGGVEALEKIISKMPTDIAPILVVQHMPSGFTKFFAERLNGRHNISIKEAEDGDFLMQGQLMIAPAGNHMRLATKNGKLKVECFLGPKVHGVIPAADILFDSIAEISREAAIGVVLTGMGSDGAKGLVRMRSFGARTIGQNEASCVVYGMPKVAKDLGAVEYELHIDNIADKIIELSRV